MLYNIINYIHCVVHYILRVYSSYKCKCVPFDQYLLVSPTLQPWVTIILLSGSMNLTFLDFMYKWDHTFLSFCVWSISLCMSSRFIHVVGMSKNCSLKMLGQCILTCRNVKLDFYFILYTKVHSNLYWSKINNKIEAQMKKLTKDCRKR